MFDLFDMNEYKFQDVYANRLLPHLIGTAEFLHDDTLGLTEYPSDDEKENKNEEEDEEDTEEDSETEDETVCWGDKFHTFLKKIEEW